MNTTLKPTVNNYSIGYVNDKGIVNEDIFKSTGNFNSRELLTLLNNVLAEILTKITRKNKKLKELDLTVMNLMGKSAQLLPEHRKIYIAAMKEMGFKLVRVKAQALIYGKIHPTMKPRIRQCLSSAGVRTYNYINKAWKEVLAKREAKREKRRCTK